MGPRSDPYVRVNVDTPLVAPDGLRRPRRKPPVRQRCRSRAGQYNAVIGLASLEAIVVRVLWDRTDARLRAIFHSRLPYASRTRSVTGALSRHGVIVQRQPLTTYPQTIVDRIGNTWTSTVHPGRGRSRSLSRIPRALRVTKEQLDAIGLVPPIAAVPWVFRQYML